LGTRVTPRFTLAELVARLGGEASGEVREPLVGVATLDEADATRITFLANPRYRSRLGMTRAGAVILAASDRDAAGIPSIVAANPYAYFARVAQLFHPPRAAVAGVHPSAVVDATASVAPTAEVAATAVIGPGARIGERAVIGPGSVIGEGVTIGDDCLLHARVTIYADCQVGDRCILHSGCVVGADGFGFAADAGQWVKIPQVGRVIVGADVEIGANTSIDRGAMGDTVIEEGVKLDNQVQVAHNCRIGAHTVVAGCVGISGSTSIGSHCLIGGGVGLVGHISIADGVTISGMTLVTKSITAPGTYTSAMPFMAHAEWLRNAAQLRRLDEIARIVKRLGREEDTKE
jgi:UDP-3-O-[3-hydroxymyristoyl] glucosamine N-acyltransferase